MKRKPFNLLIGVMLAAVLAACGSAPSGTGGSETAAPSSPAASSPAASAPSEPSPSAAASSSATPAETETASAAASETTAATDELPDVSGLDLGTIKIVSHSPLSGPQSQFGGNARNGVQLAIEQLGPRMGFKDVQLRAEDDQATPDIGAGRANDLVTDQDVYCVVGHINSGVTLAALPTYQNANVPMITPSSTNPRITDEFTGTAYRLVGRDDVQGVVAADFAKQLGVQNVYIISDKTAYGEGLTSVFRQRAEEIGLNIVGFEGTEETSAFDAVLTPILASSPDLVFFGGIYDRAGPFLKQMREKGIQAKFLGGDGLDASDFTRLAGEAAVGANYVTVAGPPASYAQAAQFVEDYQAKYNAPAAYPALHAYDGTRACLVAIANAALEANGRPTREQVKAAFAKLEPFVGVTGNVTFNEEGDRNPATYYVFEVKSADPAAWGNNSVVSTLESQPPTN
jgi:branched-chain amino acid transport system substrate-binding protein